MTTNIHQHRVAHLAERMLYHESRGDFIAASVFAAQFIDALDHLDAHETHVIVGDHDAERRKP